MAQIDTFYCINREPSKSFLTDFLHYPYTFDSLHDVLACATFRFSTTTRRQALHQEYPCQHPHWHL